MFNIISFDRAASHSDGIQNEATALAGIVVVLRDSSGNALRETTTSSTGFYSFSSLDVASQDLLLPSTAYQLTIQLNNQSALMTTVGGRSTYLVPTLTGYFFFFFFFFFFFCFFFCLMKTHNDD